MSSETLSTTLRRLNHFDSPCATSPSISVVALRLLLGDLDGCLVLLLRVEDRLHPLLLAALHDAPVLIDEDRDLLAGDDVVLPPDARVADQLDALLAVVVLGPPGGPGPAVPRDDPDVAGRDGADHPFAPLVEVDLHPVGVLDGAVLACHDVAGEDDQTFLLEALHVVGVHRHRLVPVLGGLAGRGRRRPGDGRLRDSRLRGDDGRRRGQHPERQEAGGELHRDTRGNLSNSARTRPATSAVSFARLTTSPEPSMVVPSRVIRTGALVQSRWAPACHRSTEVSSRRPSSETRTTWFRTSMSFVRCITSPSSPRTRQARLGCRMSTTGRRSPVRPSPSKISAWSATSFQRTLPDSSSSWTSLMRKSAFDGGSTGSTRAERALRTSVPVTTTTKRPTAARMPRDIRRMEAQCNFDTTLSQRDWPREVKCAQTVRGGQPPRALRSHSTASRTAPPPPGRRAVQWARRRTSGAPSAGASARPTWRRRGRSGKSSPMKATAAGRRPCRAPRSGRSAALSPTPSWNSRTPSSSRRRATAADFRPEITATSMPAARARTMAWPSRTWNTFVSSPAGP